MIEIKCLECINCTGDSCKVYGYYADKAVKSCADDFFKNYQITRAGAINHLEDLRVFGHELTEADKEALGMAIEALQEPEIVHCRDCELHNSCSTEDIFNFFRMENGFCAVGSRRQI